MKISRVRYRILEVVVLDMWVPLEPHGATKQDKKFSPEKLGEPRCSNIMYNIWNLGKRMLRCLFGQVRYGCSQGWSLTLAWVSLFQDFRESLFKVVGKTRHVGIFQETSRAHLSLLRSNSTYYSLLYSLKYHIYIYSNQGTKTCGWPAKAPSGGNELELSSVWEGPVSWIFHF